MELDLDSAKTIHVVILNTDMVFAFYTREEAEEYIRQACKRQYYSRQTLYVRSVELVSVVR